MEVLRGHLASNLLTCCWNNRIPFQIDANLGGTAGIAELLLQSHAGQLHLLPALPEAWPEGCVEGLCARGCFEVDMEWKGGKLIRALIHSESGGECTVRWGTKVVQLDSIAGTSYELDGELRVLSCLEAA
jgi:alpha-L-fucosidase 2